LIRLILISESNKLGKMTMELVKFNKVSKFYPGVNALENVSLSILKGSIHGLLGPNGAGKSTAMKILCGLTRPEKGSVLFLGEDVFSSFSKIKGQIGLLPENPPLYSNMKVVEFLTFIAKINGTHNISSALEKVIYQCKLNDVTTRLIRNLSRGFKQRVAIAQAIIFSPELVILDEPTLGLDPEAIFDIRKLICELKNQHTILVSTHQLSEAEQMCTHISILNKGRLIKTGNLNDIETSFQAKQAVRVRIPKVENLDTMDIEKVLSCRLEVSTSEKNEVGIRLFFDEKRDKRLEVANYFVRKNLGLLELSKEELSLEEIFRRATLGDMK